MSETSTLIGYSGRTIGREELTLVPTPAATETHRPVPHHEIVQALVETLGFRHIGVVHDEYAVSPDGMKALWRSRSRNRDGRMPLLHRTSQLPRQEHASGDDLWLSRVRVLEHGVRRGLHARCSPNTRSRSRSSTASRWASTACSATSSPCESRWRRGREVNSPTSRRRWSSTKRLWRADSKLRSIWPAPCMTSTSSRSTRNSGRERSGVSPMRSLRHSRNWIPIPQFKATAKLGEFLEARFSQSF